MHMQELHVGQANHQAHMGCDTENAEMNIENLADSDGPSDTAGLRVYAMNKPYTNIETLDNCLTAQKPAQSGLASPSMSQLKWIITLSKYHFSVQGINLSNLSLLESKACRLCLSIKDRQHI